MANEQNLIPINRRTKCEQQEIHTAGGAASGASRRRKRSIREAADLYLSLPPADKRRWNRLCRQGVGPKDIDNQMAMIAGLTERAIQGDARAARVIVGLLEDSAEQAETAEDMGTFELPARLIAPAFAPVHLDISAHNHLEYVEKGGRGSTKSSFISLEIVSLIKNNQQMHALCCRKVGTTLRDSVYSQILWAIDVLGLNNEFDSTKTPLEITSRRTGQKIYFRGADDPVKLKSIKPAFGHIGILWFEELDQFAGEEECRNIQQSAIRGGDDAYIFKSFNPPAMARNWANKYVLASREDRLVTHSDYRDVPAKWLGRPFLEEADALRQTNETAYRHEYLGEVVGGGAAVFENLRLEPLTDGQIAALDYHYFGQDWGWYPDPNHFVGCAYDSGARTLYIYEEFRGLRQSNAAWAEKIRHHMDDLILADPGAGGSRNAADFRAYGFRMREAQKGPGSVAYGVKWLQSLAAIVIDPDRCPETAKEFSEYEYERDPRTGEVLEGYPDAANHSIDAVRYALEPVWKRRGQ